MDRERLFMWTISAKPIKTFVMKNIIKNILLFIAIVLFMGNCKKQDYKMGALSAPSDVTITITVEGVDATNPHGDGSGNVEVTVNGKNVIAYMIDYDASDGINPELMKANSVSKRYTRVGLHTYQITLVAYGAGATATTITGEVTVQSNFSPDPEIVEDLTGGSSKTWKIEKNVAGHFGVGPWSVTSTTPEWWSAAPNEKADCCNCFYSASFTFTKTQSGFSLTTNTPDGAFTKTGALAGGLPGIPSTGDEACYPYAGGTSSFSFVPAGSGLPSGTPSTQTSILLGGKNTFIGYGALQKEYEILSVSADNLYLRAQGTETGNAWYLKLIPQ